MNFEGALAAEGDELPCRGLVLAAERFQWLQIVSDRDLHVLPSLWQVFDLSDQTRCFLPALKEMR